MLSIRRPTGPLAIALLLCLASSGGATQHAAAKEDALKAAFAYRIASFVSWPVGALGPADAAFGVVVVGDADLADHMHEAFADRRIQGRSVRVTSVAEAGQVGSAHVVFLSKRVNFSGFLGRSAGSPVLTMSDAGGFAARGGVVELVRSGGRLRFELNAASARRAGLKLSSQVLRLASHVHEASADG